MKGQSRRGHEKKVFIGLSGGVDSAVSAALLKRTGYDVTGVFIRVWQPDWIECNWKEERLEAMRVAAHLGIPFVALDLVKEYKQGVIDYMLTEYASGRTPNPDVMCNREVKFGAFWRWAKEHDADFIATGHYAQIARRHEFSASRFTLHVSRDPNKDQSYFLWTLTQDDLSHTLFPVGGMIKPEVRKLAKRLKLPNADKKDSQGLCFIGKVDVKRFLAHYIKGKTATKQGDVLDEAGKAIGRHPGAMFFTIGERHGFMIDAEHKTPDGSRLFVIGKDMDANTITVANRDKKSGGNLSARIKISSVNWIARQPRLGEPLKARGRYREPLKDIDITEIGSDGISVTFKERPDAVAPGQSVVIYDADECLGGGVIVSL